MLKTMLLDKTNQKFTQEIKNILNNWNKSNAEIESDIAVVILLKDNNLIGFYRIVNQIFCKNLDTVVKHFTISFVNNLIPPSIILL